VRYQTAFALGEIVYADGLAQKEVARAVETLARMLLGDSTGDRWLSLAALSSLSGHEADVLASYPDTESRHWSDLASIVARRGKKDELAKVTDRIERDPNSSMAKATLATWFASPTAAVRDVLRSEGRPKLQRAI